MANFLEIEDAAKAAGFDVIVPLDCSTIELRPEVRAMCETNKCGIYAKNWSCPPGCGTLEECAERVGKYKFGVIVQTVGQLEDEFDAEGIMETSKKHKESFYEFAKLLREKYPKALPLGAGGCTFCKECTYPDRPCRSPENAVSSMESYGMVVSEVCKKNNVPYYYGKGTQVFVSCYLID